MTALRTLALALLASLALTASAQADMTPQQKREYVASGAYLADVTAATAPAKAWLDQRSDQIAQLTAACAGDGDPGATQPDAATCAAVPDKPALVLDIDETAMSNYIGVPLGDPGSGSAGQVLPAALGVDTAMPPILDLYRDALARGITVFFITARPPEIQPTTVSNLHRVGYTTWGGLSFKPEDQFLSGASNVPYKSGERARIEAAGYTVILNVGDQQSDLDGGHAERAVKLPNPFYTSS
jgi:predicted secreted acid phosphatase